MKKTMVTIAFVFSLAVTVSALRVNPGSNASGDSANTALTLVYRDASGDFAAAKITATTLEVTGTTTNTGAVTLSTATLTGGLGLAVKPKTFFGAAVGVIGRSYLCSDCTIAYSVCVGTGTGTGDWKVSHSATVGCNE